MVTIQTAILSAVGGLIFGIFIAFAKKIRGITEAIKALSHDALFTRCETHIRHGEISASELENLGILYQAYRDQGLNGTGEELYNRAKSLPLKQESR